MNSRVAIAAIAVLFAHCVVGGCSSQGAGRKQSAADFSFANVEYVHRFSKDDRHEYTPRAQGDVRAWTDMTTIQYFPGARNSEALAATANDVLETFQANAARVLRVAMVPQTGARPAEHLIVAVFDRGEFLEAAFARFRLHGGVGTAVIYSHRIRGANVQDEMIQWLEKHGPATEAHLMSWDAMPRPPAPE